MLFSRVASFFAVFFTLGAIAFANPVEKRQSPEVTTVLNTLKSSTNAILPQLQAMASNRTANTANVTPMINDLVKAINTASTGLRSSEFSLAKRDDAAVAALAAGIIEDISTTLNVVLTEASIFIPGLSGLLITVDVALQELLGTLNIVVVGVLGLIGGLLGGVISILSGLSFGLVLGLLGL